MTFNPATFIDSTAMSPRQVQALGHADDRADDATVMVQALKQAAARFALRRDSFAQGKADTCLDLAAKLERFGSFASDKQAGFAAKLVEWSKPRQAVQAAVQAPRATPVLLPRLFALMQRLAKLEIGRITIARKNGDSLCWIKYDLHSGVIGKIENGQLFLFQHRIPAGTNGANVLAELLAIEADPEAAAVLHGRASGRCALCSRDLTDPESIERGIGPICAGRFA